ncbi:MAG: hypothetical protein WCL44_07490 [bacterium]
MRKVWSVAVAAGVVLASAVALHAERMDDESMAQWRFGIGISYISGFADVIDYYESKPNMESLGGSVPIGLALAPYYQFDHGSRIGVDLGPFAMVLGDVSYWDVPVALSYGFSFVPHGSVSPYVRVGVKHHFVGGDDVDKSTPGGFAAFGMEFMRKKFVAVQIEAGYDASEVTFSSTEYDGHSGHFVAADETIKTGALIVSLRAAF